VPVGKDQLPHLELTARDRAPLQRALRSRGPVFPEPGALLSDSPVILGLDGAQKMSKSRTTRSCSAPPKTRPPADQEARRTPNARSLRAGAPPRGLEPALVDRPVHRKGPRDVAAEIGDGGGGRLKPC